MTAAVTTIEHHQTPKLPALSAGGAVRAIVPQDFDGAWRIANAVVKAQMAPRGLDTAEKAMVAIMHGLEVGLTPMNALQSIAVVNGRPTIWGDGAIGLVRGSGLLEWMEEKFEGDESKDAFKAVCLVKRKHEPSPVRAEFSVADAKAAGLWGKQGPWQQYRKRMLQMRARAFALRDGFADVLKGLSIKEEVEDYQMKDITPEPPTPPEPKAPAAVPTQVEGEVVWEEDDERPATRADVIEPPAPKQESKPAVDMTPDPVTGIPAGLKRTRKPAEAFDGEQWLRDLAGACDGCEDSSCLIDVQEKVQKPARGKVTPEQWGRGKEIVVAAFARIAKDDEPADDLTIISAG